MTPSQAARALGGEVISRDSILAPGPGHSAKDRSLRVWLTADGPIVHSHAGDDWRACKDHVNRSLGIEPRVHLRQMTQLPKMGNSAHLKRSGATDVAPSSDLALRIWRETVPIAGTLAERYLQSRKLTAQDYAVDALRFHPSCVFGSERLPCMIGLYRDILTNKPRAIHRTALTPKGQKIDRKALGPKAGCANKLTADEDVSTGLTIAEGIETALAGMALNFRPAWALGDANEIAKFPVLAGIECLSILVDHDAAGQSAASKCARRWTAEGREVFTVEPITRGSDMADVWSRRAA